MHKEPTGLEGRSIDVGNVKIHVKNAIAEGGFSCVYLARDAVHVSKQYALKHIIINDEELLELVMKEISVMKLLRGHPNVVTLCAHTILDMGRTKEALLVMDFCEKSLVNVLESRGAGFFEEKQVLAIFRDVCNAVFAMHSQSPPIAHRDLKAENLLLGPDGLWKLCDFGSISTNHKRFEKPEEMGIEEDNIRKHTTPAYRAPEMWDLFRRELINGNSLKTNPFFRNGIIIPFRNPKRKQHIVVTKISLFPAGWSGNSTFNNGGSSQSLWWWNSRIPSICYYWCCFYGPARSCRDGCRCIGWPLSIRYLGRPITANRGREIVSVLDCCSFFFLFLGLLRLSIEE